MKVNTTNNSIQYLSAKLHLMSEFGEMVRLARTSKNLSQRALAQRIGKSATYVSYVESGVNPSSRSRTFQPGVEAVRKIAKALDLPLDEALVAAGYAPSHPVGKPETVEDLLSRLERLGVEHIEFETDVRNSSPEQLQAVYDAVKLAVELTLRRK
jgi:transcriptional regulator with XRE-family HTH domain